MVEREIAVAQSVNAAEATAVVAIRTLLELLTPKVTEYLCLDPERQTRIRTNMKEAPCIPARAGLTQVLIERM